MVIWLIGLSGSGKTTIGTELFNRLKKDAPSTVLLDGDVLREVWCDAPGHDIAGRRINAERISKLCKFLDAQDINVVACVLSIFPEWQQWNREHFSRYFEVFLDVDLETVAARDPKGIYAAHACGEMDNVVGLDIPFPRPHRPDLILDSSGSNGTAEELAEIIIRKLNA